MRFVEEGREIEARVAHLVVAGWTGRDIGAVRHHIDELAALGVAPPSQVPLFYRVSRSLLVQAPRIEVLGPDTSGEVEPLLVNLDGTLWLGLGSDHTDRQLETVSVAASKQACPKPVSPMLWRFDTVAPHLERLILCCEIRENGEWMLYQEGTLAMIRPLGDLVAQSGLDTGGAMLCGTLGAIGGVRPASDYRMQLRDPVLERSLYLEYRASALPVVA